MGDIKELNNDELKEVAGGFDVTINREFLKIEKNDYLISETFYTNLPVIGTESEVVFVPYRMYIGDVCEYGKAELEFYDSQIHIHADRYGDGLRLERNAFLQKYPYRINRESYERWL